MMRTATLRLCGQLAGGPSGVERMKLDEKAVRDIIEKFSAADRITRHEMHGGRK